MSPRSALADHRSGDSAWWETGISRVRPNEIEVRGYEISELIETLSFTEMVALLVTGRRLAPAEKRLLDAALVAGADHGPLAPSIAAARMAATCGITFNCAVATGINMLGDYHGGAVEQFMTLIARIAAGHDARAAVDELRTRREPVPGFGHQLHDADPRRSPLLRLLRDAASDRSISGRYLDAALVVESTLEIVIGKPIPLNIDGLSGIVYLELGFPPEVAKGLFSLSRGAGIVAHALEEQQRGSRIKGPCPPDSGLVRYVGIETIQRRENAGAEHEREFWSTFGYAGIAAFWGFDHHLLDDVDEGIRRKLFAFTRDVAGRADRRAEIVEEVNASSDADLLAALCLRVA